MRLLITATPEGERIKSQFRKMRLAEGITRGIDVDTPFDIVIVGNFYCLILFRAQIYTIPEIFIE